MKHIMKCECGNYTLKESCPKCNKKTFGPLPPKFSPEDKYGEYRRRVKMDFYKEQGYL